LRVWVPRGQTRWRLGRACVGAQRPNLRHCHDIWASVHLGLDSSRFSGGAAPPAIDSSRCSAPLHPPLHIPTFSTLNTVTTALSCRSTGARTGTSHAQRSVPRSSRGHRGREDHHGLIFVKPDLAVRQHVRLRRLHVLPDRFVAKPHHHRNRCPRELVGVESMPENCFVGMA